MNPTLFGSALWQPALDKYAEATGLSVELFGIDGQAVPGSTRLSPLVALFREYNFDSALFSDCARRCLNQTGARPAVAVAEAHGLMVVGTSLALEGVIVGAAVAGYALAGFSPVPVVQRWAKTSAVPFDRLWHIVRQQPPVPERRLILHGELLQVLGDALLRENYRTRQYEEATLQLRAVDAAKDEFIAVLSHELRTPLAAILGWASVLQKIEGGEQVRRAAEAIERNVLIETRMVDDLLDVNRVQRGIVRLSSERLELLPLLRASMETSAQDMEKKALRFEIIDAAQPLFVDGDAGRLQQVFRNIFSNAVKFTPAGGGILVTLRREQHDALVIVADTGAGINAEFLPFVFDIFRQQEHGTRRQHHGLGIGLALVKQLIELHRGTVSVTSEGAGRGTEVTVRLPLAADTSAVEVTAPPPTRRQS